MGVSESDVPSREKPPSEATDTRYGDVEPGGKTNASALGQSPAPAAQGGFISEILATSEHDDGSRPAPDAEAPVALTTETLQKRIAQVEEQLQSPQYEAELAHGWSSQTESLERQLSQMRDELEQSLTMIRTEQMSKDEALEDQKSQAEDRQRDLERRHVEALAKAKTDRRLTFSDFVHPSTPKISPSDSSASALGREDQSSVVRSTDGGAAEKAPAETDQSDLPFDTPVRSARDLPLVSDERSKLEAELDDSRDKIDDLSAQVADLQAAISSSELAREHAEKALETHEHASAAHTSRMEAQQLTASSLAKPGPKSEQKPTDRRRAVEAAVAQTQREHQLEMADLEARHSRMRIELQNAANERLAEVQAQFDAAITSEQDRRRAELASERQRRRMLVESTSNRLNDEIHKLRQQVTDLQSAHGDELQRVKQTESEERSNNSAKSRADADLVQSLRSKVTLARAGQSTANAQREDLREQLTGEISDLNERLNSVHAEVNKLRSHNQRLVDETSAQATRLSELTSSFHAQSDEIAAEVSEQAEAQHRTEIAQLLERHAAELDRQRAESAQAMSALEHDHQTAIDEQRRAQRAKLNAEHDRLTQAVERAEERFESQLDETQRALTVAHQSELADERRRTVLADEQASLLSSRVTELEAETASMRQERTLLQQQLSQAQAPILDENRQLTARLAASEVREAKLRDGNAQLREQALVERSNVTKQAAADQTLLRSRLQDLEQRLATELERTQSAHQTLLTDAQERLASAARREAVLESRLEELGSRLGEGNHQ